MTEPELPSTTIDNIDCRICRKPVSRASNYCPFCGSFLKEEEIQNYSRERWLILKNVIFFYVILMVVLLPLFWIDDDKIAAGLILISGLDALIIFIFALVKRFQVFSLLQLNRNILNYTLGSLFLLIPMIFFNLGYNEALIRFFGLKAEALSDPLIIAGYGFGWVVFINCLMPAVWEEIAFRGLIQGELSKVFRSREAIIITAMLFAIIHVGFFSWPYLFLYGLILGIFRSRSKSLWPGIVSHFVHNLVVVLIEYFRIYNFS